MILKFLVLILVSFQLSSCGMQEFVSTPEFKARYEDLQKRIEHANPDNEVDKVQLALAKGYLESAPYRAIQMGADACLDECEKRLKAIGY